MMSNEEEKRCPLCAEEMDWTDQQFKPCQCGYQVCVWCWHHIIDMAEKEQAEGRCPACRTVYEKQKIVTMQANCERTVNKNTNRKTKPPKAKPKTIEVKKDLTNIRVIQRKMAYVIGLPLSLADEDLLQRREYFGQYGKVTKVSLSRTAGGAIQQFLNDTCSVYITYSKEEEALRCIQSVHGFVLEGRFLRASFGTAKYCHAWLKNMPCNNAACLYLHSIGADEDSFGKDEVAAVHTRSRVQEMVGAANIAAKRSGNVLPPPMGDLYNSMGLFPDKSTVRSPISDTASHGSVNISGDVTCSLPSKERGGIAVPHKTTTFVDIVGRSNSSGSEKDQNILEDRTIFDLSSDLSSIRTGGDTHPAEPYSVPNLFKVSSSDCIRNGSLKNIPDEPLHEDSSVFDNGRSKDTYGSSQRAHFLDPSYTANVSEDSGSSALGYKRSHNLNDITLDSNAVNNREYEDYLPIRNTVFSDTCQDMFRSSTKSDRIYRSSNSFSNEEIVEHLRRIDDNDLTNDEENSALHAVERSIISNIMSIDFDSCEDSMTMPNGLSEIPDETNVLRGSSWNSHNGEKPGYSFLKQDGFPSQMAGPVLPDFGYNKEHNLFKPQYPVTRPQSSAPPGFSLPSRDPPPGFSTGERTGSLPRASSGSRLVNSSLSSTPPQPPSTGYSTRIDNADFFDPAILNWGKSKPTNGVKAPGFEMRPATAPQMSTFEEDAKLWLLMQQKSSACQESKFSQMFPPQTSVQQEPVYTGNMGSGLYGLSSRVVDQHKNYDSSSFPQLSQNKYANGRISNTNGYMHGLNDVQHKGEVGMSELERNERLRVDKYYPGYGDLMFSSGDVYTRVFGL